MDINKSTHKRKGENRIVPIQALSSMVEIKFRDNKGVEYNT